VDPFSHAETEAYGLVFQHYAYVTQEQLQFKECYYGYAGAISQWKRLQQEIRLPVRLRQYFSWVGDLTMVDRPEVRGVTPIAQQSAGGCQWCFNTDGQGLSIKMPPRPLPLILIDGVFFQLYKTKFVQVWRSLLEQWVENGFSKHIILLDRGGTAPDIPGIHYYPIQPYVANDSENDRQILQQACDRLEADLFVSTYFTVPLATPSVLMLSNLNLSIDETQKNAPHPIVKRDAITYASAYITFSQNIADDLIDHFPDQVQRSSISVVHNGVSPCFKLATTQQVSVFKHRYGITKPYFLLVVDGNEKFFQNNELFFRGLDHLITKIGIDIIATTQSPNLPDQWRNYTNGSTVHLLQLTEEELAVAYCGAIALVQSTKDEGFILPMAEAMACGCPVVVSCPQSLFSEGVDYAPVLYVRDSDSEAMANALCDIQKPGIRQVLIHQGLQQTSLYTWQRMAEAIQSQLVKTTLTNLNLQSINWIFSPNWRGSEDLLYEDLAQLIDTFVHHPESNQMTLLIDNHNLMDIDLEWMLVDIAVNTLMKDDLNSDEPSINLLGKLSPIQWSTVAQFIQGWLVSPNQDDSITCANQYHIPIIMLDERTPPSFQVK
jgi:glycosyltransferase involved in cell wall biosynthesis